MRQPVLQFQPRRKRLRGAHSGHFLNVLDEERCSSRRCLGLRAAFGFVEVLRIVDHNHGQDQDDGEPLDEGEEPPPVDR